MDDTLLDRLSLQSVQKTRLKRKNCHVNKNSLEIESDQEKWMDGCLFPHYVKTNAVCLLACWHTAGTPMQRKPSPWVVTVYQLLMGPFLPEEAADKGRRKKSWLVAVKSHTKPLSRIWKEREKQTSWEWNSQVQHVFLFFRWLSDTGQSVYNPTPHSVLSLFH